MLSIGMDFPITALKGLDWNTIELLSKIDNLGYKQHIPMCVRGDGSRMIYYAKQILKRNPPTIAEIGGGVGQFYATLRALGWKGKYWIFDIEEVRQFQHMYLSAISVMTGLELEQDNFEVNTFCVSFYALGEFDDELKQWYIDNVVSKCPHGFVIWNPHSGASSEIDFGRPVTITDEYPLLAEGNKQIEW